MSQEELLNTLKYILSEKVIKDLLKNRLITPEEYEEIDIFNKVTFSINPISLYS